MKNLILLILTLLPLFLKAQYETWMPGKALTDSSHNNRNVCVNSQFDDNIMFWEQELNATTTQLCYKNINSTSGDVQIALSIPSAKLTNPKILNLAGSVSRDAEVIYQTNEGNDIDLNYFTYKSDGTISEPRILSNLPGDDINLTTAYSGIVAWENSGRIWISEYLTASNSFTEPFAIDSAGAYSPTLESNIYLAYLKPNGDSTIVINENPENILGKWIVSGKTSKSFIGKGSSLIASDGMYSSGNYVIENKVGENPQGLMLFSSLFSDIENRNSPTYNLSHPAIAEYMIGVKSNFGYHFLAYISDSLIQNEIFIENPFGYYWEPQNISQNPGDDRNPQFYVSFHSPATIRVTLFWESERQGFYSIYTSYFDYLFGGIDESEKTETILANPCPFDQQTTIRFQAAGKTNVRIFDLQGNEVKKLLPQKDANGWQNAVWDGTNFQGNSVPSGSYLLVAGSGNETQSRIIIKK
ncbi:MAG: FlgD immunoglobulin-like domain containing protein [Bacteroidales bacterium]|nr:FlgD immunoglobulin-like domain containing protein [Bacteroidales bacterium]